LRRGGVEHRDHLEGGLRWSHIRAGQDRVVGEAVRESVGWDGAHVASRRDVVGNEEATKRISASQCSPVRGHDMSLA